MKDASIESARSEPTVFGAVRRYRIMVLAFALAATVAAVGYSRYAGETYRASANVSVPVPQSLQNQNPAQYLDSQVLLLQSPAVAERAASIADSALNSKILSASDFAVGGGKLTIAAPVGAAAGAYGASIIGVQFTASSPAVAKTGANAVLQAFDDVRSATIAAQFNNAIAGIDNVISSTTSATQLGALKAERDQQLVGEQIDLAQHPAMGWAAEPAKPVSGSWKREVLIGLVIGLVLGAAVAYIRAGRRQGFVDQQDPAELYGVPLIGEIPAFEAEKALRSNRVAAGGLPMSADPDSAVAEAFRFAAGSVERIRADRGPRLSLVFVSPLAGAGKSMLVANLALALAEGGTRVLVVDADAGDLTARLLPGIRVDGGLEQVLAGQRPLQSCVQPSPLSGAVAVLGSGPASLRRLTGAARSKAASSLLDTAKSTFDVVLIDSPGLLQVADAAELVRASDAAIVVLDPNELIRDHVETVDRLKLIGSDVVGYIYNRAPMPAPLARYKRDASSDRRNGSSAYPVDDSHAFEVPARSIELPPDGGNGTSSELRHG